MTGFEDPEAENRLTESIASGEERPEADGYELADVVRGRMFCLSHGRECYRRVQVVGESEWVCPDERHARPIRVSS